MTSNERNPWVEQGLARQEVLSEEECARLGSWLIAASHIQLNVPLEDLPFLQVRANELTAEGIATNTLNAHRLLPGMAVAILFKPLPNVDRHFIHPRARHISLQRLTYLQCIEMRDDAPRFQVGVDYTSCYDAQGNKLQPHQAAYAPDNRTVNRLLTPGQFISHIGATPKADGVLGYNQPLYWTQDRTTEFTTSLGHAEQQDRVEAVFVQASPAMQSPQMVVGPLHEDGLEQLS